MSCLNSSRAVVLVAHDYLNRGRADSDDASCLPSTVELPGVERFLSDTSLCHHTTQKRA